MYIYTSVDPWSESKYIVLWFFLNNIHFCINKYSSVTEIYMNIAKIGINVQCKEQLQCNVMTRAH